MAKKKLLLGEQSKTMTVILQNIFEENGYEFDAVSDGVELLKSLYCSDYDAVVCAVNIPLLDGYQLSRIIKNTAETSDMPVILFSTELSSVTEFWSKKAGVDTIVLLDGSNPQDIAAQVDTVLSSTECTVSSLETRHKNTVQKCALTDRDIAILAAESIHADMFRYIFTEAIYETTSCIHDIEKFSISVMETLIGICAADIISFEILDGIKVIEYCSAVPSLSAQEKNDFLRVAHSDFEQNAPDEKDYAYLDPVFLSLNAMNNGREPSKIASYEYFVLCGSDFIGTLNIGSSRKDFFSDYLRSRLMFFVEKISMLMETVLEFKQTMENALRIRSIFSRFVPGEIIDDLIRDERTVAEYVGEKRRVAVMITDIRDFTTISEVTKPENVVSFLNHYFTVMVDIIKKHGGSIDKFMGDAIMATFGATVSYEDNAKRAVDAAIEMNAAVENIDKSLLVFPEGKIFNIGTGIHYGDVIVGSIGCAEKTDYTVIGDSVNLSSRLESLTKQYGAHIIITDAVRENLDDSYVLRHLDNVKVKGKSIAASIYAVDSSLDEFPAEYRELYSKAVDLYAIGVWRLAADYFSKALEVCPDDKASQLMLERCSGFITNPPSDWDGAISLTSK